jgi:hypothetical protein
MSGGEGGILSEHPKKFSVVMVSCAYQGKAASRANFVPLPNFLSFSVANWNHRQWPLKHAITHFASASIDLNVLLPLAVLFVEHRRSNPALCSGTGVKAGESPFGTSVAQLTAALKNSKSAKKLKRRSIYLYLPISMS